MLIVERNESQCYSWQPSPYSHPPACGLLELEGVSTQYCHYVFSCCVLSLLSLDLTPHPASLQVGRGAIMVMQRDILLACIQLHWTALLHTPPPPPPPPPPLPSLLQLFPWWSDGGLPRPHIVCGEEFHLDCQVSNHHLVRCNLVFHRQFVLIKHVDRSNCPNLRLIWNILLVITAL